MVFITLGILIPFIVFQITVILFIIFAKLHQIKLYCSSFFTLFLVVTIIDTVAEIDILIGIPVLPFDYIEILFLNNPIFSGIVFQISSYTLFSQCYIHWGIAINRFWISLTTTSKNIKNCQKWQKFGKILIFCLPFITIPFLIPRFWYNSYAVRDIKGKVWPAYNVSAVYQSCILIYSPTLCICSAVISFILQIATIIKYKNFIRTHSIKLTRINHEIRLLCQAMIVLTAQMLMTGIQIMFTIAYLTENFPLNKLAAENYFWVQNISNLCGPIALMIVGKKIRQDYLNFLFCTKQISAIRIINSRALNSVT